MSAFALITGRLYGEPMTRPTKTGGQVTFFKLRVVNGELVEFWSIATFSDEAREELAGLREGAPLSAVGALRIETYLAKNGETKPSLNLTADRVVTLKPKAKERVARDGWDRCGFEVPS
jgi:hypothetical protein